MELIIKTDLQAFPAVIEYNHEELKSELSEQLQKFKNSIRGQKKRSKKAMLTAL